MRLCRPKRIAKLSHATNADSNFFADLLASSALMTVGKLYEINYFATLTERSLHKAT